MRGQRRDAACACAGDTTMLHARAGDRGHRAHLRGFASYGPAVETGRVVDLAVETGRALLKTDEWSI